MIIAANWKMNLSRQNAGDLLKSYRDISADASASLITFVPACYLALAEDVLSKTSVQFGAQDCHAAEKGAFTGDISASMIADLGAGWV